jgi:hypothetical protein
MWTARRDDCMKEACSSALSRSAVSPGMWDSRALCVDTHDSASGRNSVVCCEVYDIGPVLLKGGLRDKLRTTFDSK